MSTFASGVRNIMKRKFSERIGITKPNAIQIESMDNNLRNSLWNLIFNFVLSAPYVEYSRRVKYICERYLKFPRDDVPENHEKQFLKGIFYNENFSWWHVYDLIEFIAKNPNETLGTYKADKFIAEANRILEEEIAGYRFVDGFLTPITNKTEIGSIEESITTTRKIGLMGANTHLETAVELLAKRPDPDYRNSIKESISAIESLVKQITGNNEGGLDKALGKLDAKVKFHGAFKSGLLSLYGYTSDEDGIRHAILEEAKVGFDEAKFMLVACSALVNLIIAKAAENDILPDSRR